MTSERYGPAWDIAEVTQPGGPRSFVMVNVDVPLWVLVIEWRRNEFCARVYDGGRLVRRFERVCDATAHCEF